MMSKYFLFPVFYLMMILKHSRFVCCPYSDMTILPTAAISRELTKLPSFFGPDSVGCLVLYYLALQVKLWSCEREEFKVFRGTHCTGQVWGDRVVLSRILSLSETQSLAGVQFCLCLLPPVTKGHTSVLSFLKVRSVRTWPGLPDVQMYTLWH